MSAPMDPVTLTRALYRLAAVVEELRDYRAQAAIGFPVSQADQLRWTRTHQQLSRDGDAMCEAMTVLLRWLHGAERDWAPY
jgi:hypothetical protein